MKYQQKIFNLTEKKVFKGTAFTSFFDVAIKLSFTFKKKTFILLNSLKPKRKSNLTKNCTNFDCLKELYFTS